MQEEQIEIYQELLQGHQWKISHNSHLFGILIPVLVLIHDIKTIIEIGIDKGWVTQVAGRSLAENAQGTFLPTLFSCDTSKIACDMSSQWGSAYPVHHIVLCQDSNTVSWKEQIKKEQAELARLCVVDGAHNYAAVLQDFVLCDMAIPENGFILAHDYSGEVEQAYHDFVAKSPWEWHRVIFYDNSTTALLQKGRRK